MIDKTTGKPYVQVFEGPLSADGTKQFYYLCYNNTRDVGCVELASTEDFENTLARAFMEMRSDETSIQE
jgi:hypothetical protein